MINKKMFNLYSSEGCHLCEDALQLCHSVVDAKAINVIDIVEDDKLVELYGMSIPVLERLDNNEQISGKKLFWPFTQQQIKELI